MKAYLQWRAVLLAGICVLCAALPAPAAEKRFLVLPRCEEGRTVWWLQDRDNGSAVSVLPELGANCFRYRAGGRAILLEPASVDALCRAPLASGIPLMFPFACGVSGAAIRYNGEICRMKPNPTGPPIRSAGLVFRRPFQVVEAKGGATSATLLCELDSTADPVIAKEYLWPFRFRVRFSLDAEGLSCHYSMYNSGRKSAPVMFGIHPYFAGRGPIAVPATRRYHYEGNLSNGESVPFDGRISGDMLLGALKYDKADSFACRIGTTRMRCSGEFGFINLYFPPGRDSVAVEPLVALPDAANLRDRGVADTGLRELPPGKTFDCRIRIEPDLSAGGT